MENQIEGINSDAVIDTTASTGNELMSPSENQGSKQKQVASIKQKIIELNNGNDVEKSEYTNLILDDLPLFQISDEDKLYLEEFTECIYLSMNQTQLKSLKNLPALSKLERIDLNDNSIEDGLELLAEKFLELRTLKINNNKIKEFTQIQNLQSLKNLKILDLSGNPVSFNKELQDLDAQRKQLNQENQENEKDQDTLQKQYFDILQKSDYSKRVREMLPQLEILDKFDKEGNEVISENDESEQDDEDEQDDSDGEQDDEEPGYGSEEQEDDQQEESNQISNQNDNQEEAGNNLNDD